MRTLSNIFILAVLLLFGWFAYELFAGGKPVSRREFQGAHRYLNRRIDTLRDNQRQMLKNQRVLYGNQRALLDSIYRLNTQLVRLSGKVDSLRQSVRMLQTGQYVIYDALTSPEPNGRSKSKFRQLIEWFSGQ